MIINLEKVMSFHIKLIKRPSFHDFGTICIYNAKPLGVVHCNLGFLTTLKSNKSEFDQKIRPGDRTKYQKGSCLFAVALTADIVGSQNFQTFSTRQTPHIGD